MVFSCMPRLPRPWDARLRRTAESPATIAIAGTTSGRVHRMLSTDRSRGAQRWTATTAGTNVTTRMTAASTDTMRLRMSGATIFPESARPVSPDVVKLPSARKNE